MKRTALLSMLLGLLAGCAGPELAILSDLEPGRLPPPDTVLEIRQLGPCTDSPDRRLRLDASQPVTVLVHGCYGSSGQFRGLAQVLAFHGQQTACFTYDDRARLIDSAIELRRAIGQLADQSTVQQITLIGHSQGALIARKSMTEPIRPDAGDIRDIPDVPASAPDWRLVTVSGPFAGIESARTCGRTWLYPLTLGLLPLSCYVATGPKWEDITYSSGFILDPGELSPRVVEHLKIDTDERGSCRREAAGRCIESDDVFSLDEQRSARVDNGPRTTRIEVAAGHVEIVGDQHAAPEKLISVLQDRGVLRPTPLARREAFNLLLSRVYREGPAVQGRRNQTPPRTAAASIAP